MNKHDKPYFKPEERSPMIRLRPDPPTDEQRLEAYETRRFKTPLGGLAHDHQVITPPCFRPVFVKQRRLPREVAKGGSLWWRLRMESLTEKRKAAAKVVLARAA